MDICQKFPPQDIGLGHFPGYPSTQKRSTKFQTPPSTTDSRVQGSITKTSTTPVYKGSEIQIFRTLSCLRGYLLRISNSCLLECKCYSSKSMTKSRNKGQTVGEKYSGIIFLRTPSRTLTSGSPFKERSSPRDMSLDLANHNQTANLDTGRLGGWAKQLGTSQKARVACQKSGVTKGCEFPKGVSNQRVRVAKGYEHQEVRGPRGTKDRRGECSKRCLLRQVVSDPYGSVYDLLSQYKRKAGSGKEVRWAIEPDFMGRSNLNSIRLDGLVFRAIRIYSKSRGSWLNDLGYRTKPSIVESIRSILGYD
ncbi:hypothetical protein IGI04_026090 [Brassica rapa subsp. trilocularis]|uniref:Uncharacterized protein n=1 Tax=Brassica rapa subsp. trilocularis TaxID=1813537 RepID=A0ABQ7KUZ0_BRACM|nr:hypothetical protein IGI04_026090 [Brassica rapa subsp. trilocularis]